MKIGLSSTLLISKKDLYCGIMDALHGTITPGDDVL
jgi:hypothetical protein